MSDQDPSWPSEPSDTSSTPDGSSGTPPPTSPPPSSPPPSSPPPSDQPQGSWQSSSSSGAVGSNDLGIRFAARLIDWILLFVVNFAITAVLVVVAFGDAMTGGAGSQMGLGFGFSALGLLTSLIPGAYFIVMEGAFDGRTVGKMLLSRQVRTRDGGPVDFQRAFRREWWNLLYVIPFIGWLIVAGIAIFIAVGINNGNAWHDEMADTTVVPT